MAAIHPDDQTCSFRSPNFSSHSPSHPCPIRAHRNLVNPGLVGADPFGQFMSPMRSVRGGTGLHFNVGLIDMRTRPSQIRTNNGRLSMCEEAAVLFLYPREHARVLPRNMAAKSDLIATRSLRSVHLNAGSYSACRYVTHVHASSYSDRFDGNSALCKAPSRPTRNPQRNAGVTHYRRNSGAHGRSLRWRGSSFVWLFCYQFFSTAHFVTCAAIAPALVTWPEYSLSGFQDIGCGSVSRRRLTLSS